MSLFATIEKKWNAMRANPELTRKKFRKVGVFIRQYRGVLACVPVAVAMIWLAVRNGAVLPEMVGINLLADGTFSMMVARPVAVLTPLLVTLVCIFLTACSKRTLFPWMVSVLSLLIPLLIWFTNVYPA